MMVLEKVKTSVKYLLSILKEIKISASSKNTTIIPSSAGMRLFIRSVFGSACPIPPQTEHGKPLNEVPFNSLIFMQTLQECSLIPLLHVPVPEQCAQG
ncbi:hypothetical protein [Plesiomonas shigelloides]|uniref:hypothetical protein n=1 Tax=Plesiomonas shigelloides TaxID=703 RepID=UPI003261324C